MDLAEVLKAQKSNLSRREEAFVDAGAYSYDQLLPRFSVAAGTTLSLRTRPILAHMLSWVLQDTAYYVNQFKTQNPRPRPYMEDHTIIPCETDFLHPSDQSSYPSGHATNGYAAALLLAQLMPERQSLLLARGMRYGDNRVVCGVHHPIDVQQGGRIARVYIDKVKLDPQYQADLACAIEEHQQSIAVRVKNRLPYSAACSALFIQYQAEAKAQVIKAEAEAESFDLQYQ